LLGFFIVSIFTFVLATFLLGGLYANFDLFSNISPLMFNVITGLVIAIFVSLYSFIAFKLLKRL